MPREKKISDDAVKTTAKIPELLHRAVTNELRNVGVTFSLAEAINEGLHLWLALRLGDRYTQKILGEILRTWTQKYREAGTHEKTTTKLPRSGTAG